jgi:tRNA(Ile2) C34 agmatinyltransferase TiaS
MLLIGIDDTDNLESRGTGYRARTLARALHDERLACVVGVTRHQLLVDDAIPYTSHNSSACLAIETNGAPQETIFEFCRRFLQQEAADGSDVGLSLCNKDQAARVHSYGHTCKTQVSTMDAAWNEARAAGIALAGLTGTHQGIIGALAALGLHSDGNDGRYIWVDRIRELTGETLRIAELIAETGIEQLALLDGRQITEADARVMLGPWPRPVRLNGRAVLLVERSHDDETSDFQVLDKHIIKAFRP